jgi:hypothetical protein
MLADWDRCFPDCEPVAHHLPLAFPERWVRFHSLPGSKRYPENEDEYVAILGRHNEVLAGLAGPGDSVALLTTGWSESAKPVRPQRELLELDPLARPWRTIALHQQPDNFTEPIFWHVFVSNYRWARGVFDPLLLLIADGRLGNVMIVAPDCKWLLHPYDGGMDLIAKSTAVSDSLALRHREWLAPEWLSTKGEKWEGSG